MKVLMLSWEFPPFNVGGISQHVHELSRALVDEGVEVHVITTASSSPEEEEMEGIRVHRVSAYHGMPLNFISWVQQLNLAMMEKGASLLNREKDFQIIHAHDWLTAYAGRGLKHIFRLPMLATIHATEYGRNGGLFTDEQKFIGEVEWWLSYEAWKVVCCSRFMEDEVRGIFNLPYDKIEIIPNGIRPEAYQVQETDQQIKERFTLKERFAPNDEKLIFFVGRLVKEKGVQTLLRAAPMIRNAFPEARLVIAGTGPYEKELHRLSTSLGLEDYVHFVGYVDDDTRNQLYHLSSVAAFPSSYEPFGIVALEAMASRTPVVVGDVGGFQETVRNGKNGLKAMPDNPEHLAEQITYLLSAPKEASRMEEYAWKEIQEKYSWQGVARQTMNLYKQIAESPEAKEWRKGDGEDEGKEGEAKDKAAKKEKTSGRPIPGGMLGAHLPFISRYQTYD